MYIKKRDGLIVTRMFHTVDKLRFITCSPFVSIRLKNNLVSSINKKKN